MNATDSQMTAIRSPSIFWIANAPEDSCSQIAAELFSGWSKNATSWRRKYSNAFERRRCVNFDPDIAKAVC